MSFMKIDSVKAILSFGGTWIYNLPFLIYFPIWAQVAIRNLHKTLLDIMNSVKVGVRKIVLSL